MRVIPYAVVVIVAVASMPASVLAQSGPVGFGLARFIDGGRGVDAACFHDNTRTGFALRGGYDLGAYLTVQTHVRVHPFVTSADCVLAPEGPRPDGTYIVSIDRPLLARRFAATDMRLAVTISDMLPFVLASGGGVAWRSGEDVPYGVLSGAVAIPLGALRLLVEAELYHMRVGFDQVARTWQDGSLVSSAVLRREHEWSSGVVVGMALELPDVF